MTELRDVHDCRLGIQATVRHGWFGFVPGTIVFDNPRNMPPRVKAAAKWTLKRLHESGRDVSDLILDDVRVHRSETQVSFLRVKR